MRLRTLTTLLPLAAAACLDPLVSDDPSYSPEVLAPGSAIPWATDDPAVAERVANEDGVSATPIPRRLGWAADAQVYYWDFGPAPRTTAPMWIVRRCEADAGVALPGELGDVGHPNVLESIPGDTGYTPFRTLWLVCVDDRYDGELITSRRGLEDAIALGLAREPVPLMVYGDFPVTLPETALEVGGTAAPVLPNTAHYDGARAAYFHLGGEAAGLYPMSGSLLKPGRAYRLRKEDDDVFEEVVFATPRRTAEGPNAAYSPLVQVVEVTVAPTYVAGSATAEDDLFTVAGTTFTPVHAEIVEFEVSDVLANWEIQDQEGAP